MTGEFRAKGQYAPNFQAIALKQSAFICRLSFNVDYRVTVNLTD